MKHRLLHSDILSAARVLATLLPVFPSGRPTKVFPVPRGGVPAAYALMDYYHCEIVDNASLADIVVDDLIDSGATMARFSDKPFYALFSKRGEIDKSRAAIMLPNHWIIFPWEDSEEVSAEDICIRLLQFIGEDPDREGLKDTPKRMLKAWKFWTQGYKQDPTALLKVFEDGAEHCDEMVVVKDIPVYSHCEHHLAMIIGTATVAYIPNGKIVGLSKIARMVDMFARRLQVQERLTNQIANALDEHLQPLGVAVVIRARHMCMESRGVEKPGAETVTQALRGVLKTDAAARAEFMGLVR